MHCGRLALLGLVFCTALAAADASWIEDMGGAVTRDQEGAVTSVDLRATWVTDTDLRKLHDFPKLTMLDLSLTHITDQGMQTLKDLPGVVDLNLRFAEYVTDEGLAAIKGWKKLERLNVHGTKSATPAWSTSPGLRQSSLWTWARRWSPMSAWSS